MINNRKNDKFLINKRIAVNSTFGQLTILHFSLFIIISSFFLSACSSKKEEIPVIPPITSPLSRNYIGFGVITASFTHVTAEPEEHSISLGYLRRGSLVRIIRRQTIRTQEGFVSWVLTDGSNVASGWLKEEVMDIYNNESQARTASESILK